MKDPEWLNRVFAGVLRKQRSYEELKERKAASKERKASQRTSGERAEATVTEENWEHLEERHEAKSRKSKLNKRELKERAASPAEERPVRLSNTAMVIATTRRRCKALHEGRVIDCELPKNLAIVQKSTLAVGDRIVFAERDGRLVVEQILPRSSKLSRPDPHQPQLERVIAANIDVAVTLVSLKNPPLRPGLIDRYLVAIQHGDARPVVCVNKIDLAEPGELEEARHALEVYTTLDVPIIWVSAATGEGIEELRSVLKGMTAVFVGHSGVGKSSTLNALRPELEIRTGEVQKFGSGRHTTTSSILHDLGEGTLIIDTPGIREFGLYQLDRASLRWYFPEFAAAAEFCRYVDCTHTHEPVCGVKEAVLEGTIPSSRYETYTRLYSETT